MPLDPERLFRPIRKLRKQIKNLSGIPSPEEVHDVRTNCRKLEAILHALGLDKTKNGRKLLKSIKPIRRSTGKVRDMDVFTSLVANIPGFTGNESRVRLLEYLGTRRFKLVKRLLGSLRSEGKKARSSLKQFNQNLRKQLMRQQDSNSLIDPTSVSLQLLGSLAKWPKLSFRNLHPYRLKIKELRYVLQFSANPEEPLIEALEEVKDSIGEWHDWCELDEIASDVTGDDRTTQQQIHSIAKERFAHAIAITTRMRAKYIGSNRVRGSKKGTRPLPLKRPALDAVAKMAA